MAGVAWRRQRPERAGESNRRAGWFLLLAGALLLVWTCWIGAALPAAGPRQAWSAAWTGLDNWPLTWVGLDLLEVVGLTATGVLLVGGREQARTSALLSAPLFVVDAWFDVMTAASPVELAGALLLAGVVELPLAVVLCRLPGERGQLPTDGSPACRRTAAASPAGSATVRVRFGWRSPGSGPRTGSRKVRQTPCA